MKIDKIINVSKKKGLNGLAITDHNTIRGGLKGTKLNKSQNFMVICGSEISTNKGHIIGLFLSEEIRSREALEVVDDIKSQGGISIIAHPYKRYAKKEELFKKVDGAEVFNSRSNISQNIMSRELAIRYGLPMVAGSDAHFYFEIGRGLSIIDDAYDIEDIRKQIPKGVTKTIGKVSFPYVKPLSKLVHLIKVKQPKLFFSVGTHIISATHNVLTGEWLPALYPHESCNINRQLYNNCWLEKSVSRINKKDK